jgi:Cys-rich protein (TIGR01571 family)
MTRMGLDFMGLPGSDIPRTGIWSTQAMTTKLLLFWVFLNALIFFGFYIKDVGGVPVSGADIASFAMVNVGMFVYMVYAASNTRAIIREKYKINHHHRGDLEDIVYTAACMPCSVAQMGRHTISYDEHRGLCCSDTGLEEGIEADITARPHIGSYRLW